MASVLIALAVVVGVIGIFAIVIVSLVLARRSRPDPGLGPRTGVWNAQFTTATGSGPLADVAAQFGVVRIDRDALEFQPEGSGAAAWALPCRELSVSPQLNLTLDGSDLELAGYGGAVRCRVSRERINRISRTSGRDQRERRYGAEFSAALVASGAQRS